MTQTTSAMQITAVFIGAMVDRVLPYLGVITARYMLVPTSLVALAS